MPRKRKGNPVHGWVVLDKPYELGSTSAVGKVRWLFQAQKAGHGGTLDPLATGILPIALGDATKTVPFLVDAIKGYDFTLTFGQNTDTWDAEGEVTAISDARPSEADIIKALPAFIGDIEQIPPRFSAIKVDGKRSYDLARSGEVVELKSRKVHVQSVELTEFTPNAATFSVVCGKGTYIRSIARDMAAVLGTCGHVTMLRRTRVPVETALDDIPVLAITDQDASDLKQGRAIVLSPSSKPQKSEWILAMYGDKAIALCKPNDGQLWPNGDIRCRSHQSAKLR